MQDREHVGGMPPGLSMGGTAGLSMGGTAGLSMGGAAGHSPRHLLRGRAYNTGELSVLRLGLESGVRVSVRCTAVLQPGDVGGCCVYGSVA